MSLLDKLKNEIILPKKEKVEIIIPPTSPVVGGSGNISSAFNVRCKTCKEIITLSARVSEGVCSCGNIYKLPSANSKKQKS